MIDYKTEEANIANRMLEIWENQMPINRPLSLSSKRKAALNLLFTQVFSSSLSRWEEFVALVDNSRFLFEKFRCRKKRDALFKWAIKPENCLTVLDGVYSSDDPLDELTTAAVSESASAEENKHNQ